MCGVTPGYVFVTSNQLYIHSKLCILSMSKEGDFTTQVGKLLHFKTHQNLQRLTTTQENSSRPYLINYQAFVLRISYGIENTSCRSLFKNILFSFEVIKVPPLLAYPCYILHSSVFITFYPALKIEPITHTMNAIKQTMTIR